ncbi:MAG TPA: hypothetical protein DCQ06_00405 [Myxococcales bacterium]|nr:hypothetical protein [Myxococcales bacterium]HAN30032.1 hypothetical protein [Myxococcales bacterium]
MIRNLTLALACVALIGCGTTRQNVCGKLVPNATAEGDAVASVAAGDAAWSARKDVAKIREAISAWNKALSINPKDAVTRVKLSRAYYLLADGHLRTDDERDQEMKEMFKKGMREAEIAFALQVPKYRQDFCAEKPFADSIKTAEKPAVPAMYWFATNLGKWGLEEGLTTILKYKDDIKAMMDRIETLHPTYFYHAPYRYFGVYWTKIPVFRGDEAKSKAAFNKSIAGSPQYLATKVLMAQRFATKWKDVKLFVKLLDDVIKFDLSTAPELTPENTIEQRKAKELWDDADTYYDEDDLKAAGWTE